MNQNNNLEDIFSTNTNNFAPGNYTQTTVKPKSKKGIFIIIIVLLLGIGAAVYFFNNASPKKGSLVCKSDKGDIILNFKDDSIASYKATKELKFNIGEQNTLFKDKGKEEYIKEFNTWFVVNTLGECTIDGEKIEDNKQPERNDLVTVGDGILGYVTIPSSWTVKEELGTSIVYTYKDVYTFELSVLNDESGSAEELSSNFYSSRVGLNNVTNLNREVKTLGSYVLYEVYMYLESKGTHLTTYWFETPDGNIRYMSLEGPEKYENSGFAEFIFILDSFKLTK